MTKTILDIVKECDNFVSCDEPTSRSGVLGKCYTFMVNGCAAVLGYIPREIVEKIQWSDSWSIDHHQQTVTLTTLATATVDMRSLVIEDTLKATRKSGVISILESWRDENFPVYGPEGEVLLEIERCASALFGIVTYGVQLLCYAGDKQDLRLWIGKRSERKQTYPGMLDSTAAGGLGTGKLPIEALICEAQEEASIPEEIVRIKVKPMSHITYFHVRGNQAGGESGLFQPEIEYTYELELDPDTVPKPRDSEVECFGLYSVEEVLYSLKRGQFKPNSAIVIVEFLIQHGILNAENEPDYSEILSHLHRKLEFPVLIQPYN
ncbi:NUDIX hydrolase domain-like protein [Penicillium hordei]|uniref:NUDIX hydrolase domain-like protein n=1 Tax=Penicillium hordei TaxID=40994 RepID=A0AAD6GXP2_9EURO|nr:NUDIX hydrolase domain-like protein [Penicillium hordei]KAJ5593100.1 NUDIX hydrolase domain-like protein [Penicillium hordei]